MITLDDIQAALRRIRSSIYLSPCALSATFSESTANQVYLKLDNLQRTGAFKERGALNKLLSLTAEERAQGVIAASAGNHAQGVAYAARALGVKAVIAEMGSPTMKDMGTVMKNVMARFATAGVRVDGKQVSDAVKRELTPK